LKAFLHRFALPAFESAGVPPHECRNKPTIGMNKVRS
jgi:hypothetical protein